MTSDFKKIEHSALGLDEKSRAKLAKRLINSLDKSYEDEVEVAWIAAVKRRKAEIESGIVSPVSGTEVHKAARELLK